MKPLGLVAAGVLGTLIAVLFMAGCVSGPRPPAGQLPAAGLARVYLVAPGIYRSPQPSAAQFLELARAYGIRTVVKLNSAIEGRDLLPAVLELRHHPFFPAGPISHEQLVDALEELELAPRPVLVHCSHGVDRTGLLVALYRVRHGATPAAAWGEWRAYGRDENLVLLSEAFERETGWKPPEDPR